jgi:lipopolysaccharide export system protein LptA
MILLKRDRIRSILLLLSLTTASIIPTVALALPEDNQAIIYLRADSADINQAKHKGTFVGNVELDQGSTHLRSDKAFTLGDSNNKLIKAYAKGSPSTQAHYWSVVSDNKPEIHAWADTITYYPNKHLIELIGNAHVKQGENSFKAPKIIYDTEKQHVTTQKSEKMRTTITIYPEKKT